MDPRLVSVDEIGTIGIGVAFQPPKTRTTVRYGPLAI